MTPSTRGRKSARFSGVAPLPNQTMAAGAACRTTRTHAGSGACPVRGPLTMTASARPRSSKSANSSSTGRSTSGAPCLTRKSAQTSTSGADQYRRKRRRVAAGPEIRPWSVATVPVNTLTRMKVPPTAAATAKPERASLRSMLMPIRQPTRAATWLATWVMAATVTGGTRRR